jgi:hypothetical protein
MSPHTAPMILAAHADKISASCGGAALGVMRGAKNRPTVY